MAGSRCLPCDDCQQDEQLDTSSSVNLSDDEHVSTQPKVNTLADTVESLPGDESESSNAAAAAARISSEAETVPTPSKLSLIYPDNTMPKLTDHFPKRTLAKKSCETVMIGRSDSADIFLNHESMARQYATLTVNPKCPHEFLVKNLSPRKFIDIKNGKRSKTLKAEDVGILKNNVQLVLHTLEFTVAIIPGDTNAPYYEIDVKPASKVETDEKWSLQNGSNLSGRTSAEAFRQQLHQYIPPGFQAVASGFTAQSPPSSMYQLSAGYTNVPAPVSGPSQYAMLGATPAYYPPGPTPVPINSAMYFSPPPMYTSFSQTPNIPNTPFPVQIPSPNVSLSMAAPQLYPRAGPPAQSTGNEPGFAGAYVPVQDTQPHTYLTKSSS